MGAARLVWLAAAWLGLAFAVSAQDTTIQIPPPILTLDQEALYNGSRAAERITAKIEGMTEELAAENRAIEARLVAEELDLTQKRPTLTPEDFRLLADAFDEKVQGIRSQQDAKARDLQRMRDVEQQGFLRQISPILGEIVRERGAVVVLDRRSVFLSADSIDITQEAIARINAALDDGTVAVDPNTPAQDPSLGVDPLTMPDTPADPDAPAPVPQP